MKNIYKFAYCKIPYTKNFSIKNICKLLNMRDITMVNLIEASKTGRNRIINLI